MRAQIVPCFIIKTSLANTLERAAFRLVNADQYNLERGGLLYGVSNNLKRLFQGLAGAHRLRNLQ